MKNMYTILHIEDSAMDKKFIQYIFSKDYRILNASSISEAKPFLEAGVDLVLHDLNIIDSSGVATVAKTQKIIDSLGIHVPIIIYTATDDDETIGVLSEMGYRNIIIKGSSRHMIQNIVVYCLQYSEMLKIIKEMKKLLGML